MTRAVLSILLALTLASQAQDSLLSEAEAAARSDSLQNSLPWKSGRIVLPGDKAVLDLPQGFRYLDPEAARVVLEDFWGNPDGAGTLGMVFAPGEEPFGDSSWGVVLGYDDDGHIDDEDAAETDFDELLETMRKDTEEGNAARKEAGYSTVVLEGWAENPHYDGAQKKLYWAKTLVFDGNEDKTLNYFVRILGREGVLELNAVSDIGALPRVRAGMARLNQVASFTEGNRYADYNPDTDKLSELGVAALVGGGVAVAAKSGLLKGLLVGLLAMKKVLVVGVLAAFAGAKAWWDKRKRDKEEREARFGGLG